MRLTSKIMRIDKELFMKIHHFMGLAAMLPSLAFAVPQSESHMADFRFYGPDALATEHGYAQRVVKSQIAPDLENSGYSNPENILNHSDLNPVSLGGGWIEVKLSQPAVDLDGVDIQINELDHSGGNWIPGSEPYRV